MKPLKDLKQGLPVLFECRRRRDFIHIGCHFELHTKISQALSAVPARQVVPASKSDAQLFRALASVAELRMVLGLVKGVNVWCAGECIEDVFLDSGRTQLMNSAFSCASVQEYSASPLSFGPAPGAFQALPFFPSGISCPHLFPALRLEMMAESLRTPRQVFVWHP